MRETLPSNQERIRWLQNEPLSVGPNHACDGEWHDWKVEVDGDRNRLWIDGRLIGECRTSGALLRIVSEGGSSLGFSTLDTYLSVDRVRARQLP